jgi:hypothetical protein
MQFKKATKQQAKARVAIAGPSGAGKTYTALALATAIGNRVAVVDTEHGSASKYAGEPFEFDVLELSDFHPRSYIEAIHAAEGAGYDCLVVDSGSHEWSGTGGCLELVDAAAKRMKGNSYVAWGEVTPLHNQFIEAMHQSKLHLIVTYRSKMDYIQTESNGRKEVKKVGMAPITRDGAEYEFDIVLDMDLNHDAVISKTRCSSLTDKVFHRPGRELADAIKAWLGDGAPAAPAPTAAEPSPPPVAPSPHHTVDAECEDLRCEIRDVAKRIHRTRGLEAKLQEIGDNRTALEEALQKMAALERAQGGEEAQTA